MKVLRRTLGLAGLALRQLASDRARTLFAIVGVAFAVLSVTLLFGVGAGVVDTGETLLDESDRDLWVTGGPVEFQRGTVGGFQNPVVDAHTVAGEMQRHEGVEVASPLAFQTVYISADGEEFETIIGGGVRDGGTLTFEAGGPFTDGGSETHRADGDYDGPMTGEVIVNPEIASTYDLDIGDTVHVGGTIRAAEETELEVVGISGTFEEFVGSETVVMPLSELQTLTGSAHNDRATLISLEVESGVDEATVSTELEESFPEYDIRTNREQFTAVLDRQALVIASGVSLVGLAVLAGIGLSLNLFLSLIYQQRRELAVYRALGGSRSSTVGLAVFQAALIAAAGALLGVALTPVLAIGVDQIAVTVTGFEGLVQVPLEGYALGVGLAGLFGLVGTIAGVVRLSREKPVSLLIQ